MIAPWTFSLPNDSFDTLKDLNWLLVAADKSALSLFDVSATNNPSGEIAGS
jgi:hypothetical protein